MNFRDDLERLAHLQAAELQVREMDRRLAAYPEAKDACQRRVRDAEAAVKNAETERDDSQKEHRRLETELQGAETQISKYREQELDVKTNEQLWALQAEISGQQDKVSKIEEQILEELERADTLAAAIDERKAELAEATRVTADEIATIDSEAKGVESEVADVRAEVERLRAEISPDALSLYDRLATVRQGVAVAEGVDGRCLACNVRLRPQVWVGVLNMNEPVQCDACKRIVFARESLGLPSDLRVSPGD
jgi:predicted  nucleic acid-binding Zn-ribbon protein